MADRPSFAKEYPKELDELVDAFEAGNYALVREEAGKIAAGAGSKALKRAARDLASRTAPSGSQLGLLALALALLVGLSVYWLTRQEPPKTPVKGAVPTGQVETVR